MYLKTHCQSVLYCSLHFSPHLFRGQFPVWHTAGWWQLGMSQFRRKGRLKPTSKEGAQVVVVGVVTASNILLFLSEWDEVGWEETRYICQLKLENKNIPPQEQVYQRYYTNKVANSPPAPMGKDNCHGTNKHLKVWVATWQGWKQLSLFCAVDFFLQARMQVKLLLRRVKTHALTAQELVLQNCMGWGSQRASRGTQETVRFTTGRIKGKKPKGRSWPTGARNQQKMAGNCNKILGEDSP